MFIQFKTALLAPRFSLASVFRGVLILYAVILLIVFVAFYPGNTGGAGSTGFMRKQLSWQSVPIHAVALVFITFAYYLMLNLGYAGLKQRLKISFFLIACFATALVLELFKLTDALLFRGISLARFFQGSPADFAIDRILSFLLYAILAVIFVFIALQRDERENNRKLSETNRQLELEKLASSNNLLRAQINPHFLHNTLNLLYSRTRQYDKKLADGILLLSDSMRYSLDATKQQSDLVALRDEVQHLKNLISLQQLRFDEKLNIWFTTEGHSDKLMIPPLTLMTLAENAFKHGELHDPACPVQIRLCVDDAANQLTYIVSNKKSTGPAELSYGIGMENIHQRLKHVFGDRYRMDIQEDETFYKVQLTIDYGS